MGKEHFKQMYKDALAVDCQAMLLFMDLVSHDYRDQQLFGHGFWELMPVDVIMDKARELTRLWADYVTDMKRMLVNGTTSVLMTGPSGKPVRVRDPRVIDFDETVGTPEAFFYMLMSMPAQLCSGDQNA